MGDTIKTKLEGILRGCLDWRRVAHVRDIWLSVVNAVTDCVFRNMRRFFWPYEEILASHKGHCFVQLVTQPVLLVCLFCLFVS